MAAPWEAPADIAIRFAPKPGDARPSAVSSRRISAAPRRTRRKAPRASATGRSITPRPSSSPSTSSAPPRSCSTCAPTVPPAVAIPLGLMLAIDLAAWLWFRKRPISSLAPHVATRGAAGYALLANALWCAAAIAAAPVAARDPRFARHRPRRRRARHPGRLPDLPGADPARLPRPASRRRCSWRAIRPARRAAALLSALPRPAEPQARRRPAAPAQAADRDRLERAARRRASSRSSSRPAAAGSGRRPGAAPSPTSRSTSPPTSRSAPTI